MKLENFRELLIKKTNDEQVKFLARYVKNDILEDIVIESLEKMATKGNSAKSPLTSWAGSSTDDDHDMVHDALSHHITRYNAARKAGDHDTADSHLARTVHLMDFAAKAAKHSDLKFDHVPIKAWEMNYTGDERNAKGKFKQDQQGLGRRLDKGKGGKFPDYRFLEQEPHQTYVNGKAGKKIGDHRGSYPFEEIKVNNKFVDIDHDHEHSGEYEHHEFDTHPMFGKTKRNAKGHDEIWSTGLPDGQEHIDKHAADVDSWEDGEHMDKYHDRHASMEEADPEGYGNRGKTMSMGMGSKKIKKDEAEAVSKPAPAKEDSPAPSTEEPKQDSDDAKVAARREKHKALIDAAKNLKPHLRDKFLEQIDRGDYDE